MRTDCYVEQREVVAIALEDVASAITFPPHLVKRSIESAKVGYTKNQSKDFLTSTATEMRISRGSKHTRKRKCCNIWLDTLPQNIQSQLKSSKYTSKAFCDMHA